MKRYSAPHNRVTGMRDGLESTDYVQFCCYGPHILNRSYGPSMKAYGRLVKIENVQYCSLCVFYVVL